MRPKVNLCTILLLFPWSEAKIDIRGGSDGMNPIGAQNIKSYKNIQAIRENALEMRSLGKVSHDSGAYREASRLFHEAAEVLEHSLLVLLKRINDDGDGENVDENVNCENNGKNDMHNGYSSDVNESESDSSFSSNHRFNDTEMDTFDNDEDEDDIMNHDIAAINHKELAEEAATCRLHEALCNLKNGDYKQCVNTCSIVLHDYHPQEGEQADIYLYETQTLSAPLLARAHLRRAKGRLALNDEDGALEDARAAAFLGDQSAVKLYGRLMRTREPNYEDSNLFPMDLWQQNQQQQFPSPFVSQQKHMDDNGSNSNAADLFSSFMSSSPANQNTLPISTNPLASILAKGLLNKGDAENSESNNGGNLVKSMLSSLIQKIDDEDNQKSICNFLNAADERQITQYAAIAGIPMNANYASKLSSFTTNMTPEGLKRGVLLTKRTVKVINVMQKVVKTLIKYRHLIVYYFLLVWIKSSILRPLPSDAK